MNIECQTLEFKENWQDEYLKVVCAFANTNGGELIVGIDDNGNKIGVKNSEELLKIHPTKLEIEQELFLLLF